MIKRAGAEPSSIESQCGQAVLDIQNNAEKSNKNLSENWKRNFLTSTSSLLDTEKLCPKKREKLLPTVTNKNDPFLDPSNTFTKTFWKTSFFPLSSSENESSTRPTTNLSLKLS